MRSRGNIRRQFKLGVRRIIRLAPGHGSLVAADSRQRSESRDRSLVDTQISNLVSMFYVLVKF